MPLMLCILEVAGPALLYVVMKTSYAVAAAHTVHADMSTELL